ncbi:MAG: tripartite tricarboxylate transporter TctB family protein [Gemmobacter sp.]|nr:tripartite tricarboxylate transporter TctB family protein [Gemmobacter sp.]
MIPAPDKGRRPDRAAFIIALALAVIGAVLIWEGGRIPSKAGYSGVGSGDVPRLIGWVLVALAGWTVVDGMRGGFEPRLKQQPVPLLWLLGGLITLVASIHTIGFALAQTILFASAAAAFGERRFHISIPAGLVLAVVIYGVFDRILQLNLPTGPLETLIFGG